MCMVDEINLEALDGPMNTPMQNYVSSMRPRSDNLQFWYRGHEDASDEE